MDFVHAFQAGQALESAGPFERVGPDQFPLLAADPLKPQHGIISDLLATKAAHDTPASSAEDLTARFADNPEERTRFLLALIDRTFAYDAKLSTPENPAALAHFFDYGSAAKMMAALFAAGVDADRVVPAILDWFSSYRFVYYGTSILEDALKYLHAKFTTDSLPADMRERLVRVRSQFTDNVFTGRSEPPFPLLEDLLGPDNPPLEPAEYWAAEARQQIDAQPATKPAWNKLLEHCESATTARPSAKWLKVAQTGVAAIGPDQFRKSLIAWFPRVDAGRTQKMVGTSWENVDERMRMHEANARILRGLLWLAPSVADKELVRAIGRVAISSYRKIRGIGPRAVKVGNAAVYALSQIHTPDSLGQLAMLKVRVRFGTAQKEIEKAFTALATALNLPREEIEEMGVPTYGLEDVGRRTESFADGQFTATLTVDGRDVDLAWSRADGKPQKSVPAKVKTDFKDDLKELQTAAKDIAAMLPAQVERIDAMFLQQKTWALAAWRERYLDHPLVGTIARRLIWIFSTPAGNQIGIWRDGKIVTVDDEPIDLPAETQVELWHPVGRPLDDVLAWRSFLQRHQIRQPFKQAHREVYLLTDAERNTRTYSNRYAAHVIRQHQFNALCAARGWKNKLRLMVDDSYPPASRDLSTWGLRAEFWVEGIGDNYGTDSNESGVFLRLATDQVRFYRTGAAENYAHAGGGHYTAAAAGPGTDNINEPVPLDQIPPLVFSEVMRDVDLFVGVASVGNDPTWQDGGPEGRYQTYWQAYSFGDLTETAKTRKAVLETLLPRLKIAKQCSLVDKFLRVQGSLRAYKIHLGSGNILMEPNDQYLCIVAGQSGRTPTDIFLPFEGDATLALILSKAFLLANDTKITDPTITRQIEQK